MSETITDTQNPSFLSDVLTSVIFNCFNHVLTPSCHFSSFLKRVVKMGKLRIKVPHCILQHVVCSCFKETEGFASVSKRARYSFLVFECEWLYSNFRWPQDDKSLENASSFRCLDLLSPTAKNWVYSQCTNYWI